MENERHRGKIIYVLAHKLDEIKPPIWTPGVVESLIEIFFKSEKKPRI